MDFQAFHYIITSTGRGNSYRRRGCERELRYYIADLHFFHKAVNTDMDHRGFASVEEMNETMIEKWNARVRKKDEVVIIGDLSFGSVQETNELVRRLRGRLYLIKGNHDRFVWNRELDESLFQWIRPYEELSDNRRKVILCHYPVMCYNGQYRRSGDGEPLTYMLYGHVHNTRDEQLVNEFINRSRQTVYKSAYTEQEETIPCQMINCFCMFSDYTPLTLDEWIVVDERRRGMLNGKR